MVLVEVFIGDKAILVNFSIYFKISHFKVTCPHLGIDVLRSVEDFTKVGQSFFHISSQVVSFFDFSLTNGKSEVRELSETFKDFFIRFYQNHENAEVREKAFRSFSEGLRKHQNTAAATYLAQVKSEKLIADMRGYDSVFDYLLAEQEVDRAMFDRQIDLIMKDFAPVAQKFLKHVAKVNGLEKMTLRK